jgi:hypothetical protein
MEVSKANIFGLRKQSDSSIIDTDYRKTWNKQKKEWGIIPFVTYRVPDESICPRIAPSGCSAV